MATQLGGETIGLTWYVAAAGYSVGDLYESSLTDPTQVGVFSFKQTSTISFGPPISIVTTVPAAIGQRDGWLEQYDHDRRAAAVSRPLGRRLRLLRAAARSAPTSPLGLRKPSSTIRPRWATPAAPLHDVGNAGLLAMGTTRTIVNHFWSWHENGGNFVFGDGSVRFNSTCRLPHRDPAYHLGRRRGRGPQHLSRSRRKTNCHFLPLRDHGDETVIFLDVDGHGGRMCKANPCEVHGVVRMGEQPLNSGAVVFFTSSGQHVGAPINPDGEFSISGLPAGEVRVAVYNQDPAPRDVRNQDPLRVRNDSQVRRLGASAGPL